MVEDFKHSFPGLQRTKRIILGYLLIGFQVRMGLQLEHHHLKMGHNAQCLYNFVFNHIDFMLFSNLIVISQVLLLVLRIFLFSEAYMLQYIQTQSESSRFSNFENMALNLISTCGKEQNSAAVQEVSNIALFFFLSPSFHHHHHHHNPQIIIIILKSSS